MTPRTVCVYCGARITGTLSTSDDQGSPEHRRALRRVARVACSLHLSAALVDNSVEGGEK